MSEFANKTAIVTGATTGIGRALCEELAKAGAVAVVTGLSLAESQSVADRIVATGGLAIALKVDVRHREEIKAAIDIVVAQFGHLDYMFNSAGIAYIGEFDEMDDDMVDTVMTTDAMGPIYGSLYAYRVMKKQGFGHIVSVSSQAGIMPTTTIAVYCAAKHAVVGLATTLRIEAEKFGVRSSVVCPGLVKSEMLTRAVMKGTTPSGYEKQLGFPPLDANVAARRIMKGVARNAPYIFVPFYARIFWWAQRLSPTLVRYLIRQSMATFRAQRA